MELTNKVALITGGSHGLGFALAGTLGKRGARVALVAREQSALDEAVQSLRKQGIEALGIAADVADKHAIYPLLGEVQGTLGAIDIVVHNASTLGHVPLRALLDSDCEVLEQVFATNVLGPFRLSKAVAPAMVVRGEGALVHISSDAALNAYAHWGAYGTSKAALDHLARHFASELTDSGVHVLSIDPGEMDTTMHRDALPDADPGTLERPENVAERIAQVLASNLAAHHGARLLASQIGERA